MHINIYAVGFELSPSRRSAVESRLSEALRSFDSHIQSAVVRLTAVTGRHEAVGTRWDIVVSLRPSGEVRVRIEDAQMQASANVAVRAIRSAVEREIGKASLRIAGGPSGSARL